ncbi:hypothetical protein RUM44_006905 [Polyplax serrata]|uniref:Piezo TM1-24 domain-containing protein n=1 Tax=Polyplax serrata TaxID=468196 RepID=A0ABR1AZ76_POLSC
MASVFLPLQRPGDSLMESSYCFSLDIPGLLMRQTALSIPYLILFFILPYVPIPNMKTMSSWTGCYLQSIIIFSILNVLGGRLESILRQVGFIRLDHLDGLSTILMISPDVIVMLSSIIFFLVIQKTIRKSIDTSDPQNQLSLDFKAKEYSMQKVGFLSSKIPKPDSPFARDLMRAVREGQDGPFLSVFRKGALPEINDELESRKSEGPLISASSQSAKYRATSIGSTIKGDGIGNTNNTTIVPSSVRKIYPESCRRCRTEVNAKSRTDIGARTSLNMYQEDVPQGQAK